jgi:hypothetical protein
MNIIRATTAQSMDFFYWICQWIHSSSGAKEARKIKLQLWYTDQMHCIYSKEPSLLKPPGAPSRPETSLGWPAAATCPTVTAHHHSHHYGYVVLVARDLHLKLAPVLRPRLFAPLLALTPVTPWQWRFPRRTRTRRGGTRTGPPRW